ncbi:hypothetical protein PVNG_02433 [Plasmodium vivax North Korean]|uniref:Hydrolase TatD n=1 Tax=Plasmodium vivax North Korean TaxID=1035514 RepID=A0A0J9TKN1_PLAVI|nr:hypothetical protein PVNG_02433 [Plasmodium vivax North Korean]
MKLSFFDTHSHISSDKIRTSARRIVSLEAKAFYLNVSTSLEESSKVLKDSNLLENVYCAVGIHPLYIDKEQKCMEDAMQELSEIIIRNFKKVVAIGECGLDFY